MSAELPPWEHMPPPERPLPRPERMRQLYEILGNAALTAYERAALEEWNEGYEITHAHATSDVISGLPNVNSFWAYAQRIEEYFRRLGATEPNRRTDILRIEGVSVGFMDLVGFKDLNEQPYSEEDGNQALRLFGRALTRAVRTDVMSRDLAARLHGDEFVILQTLSDKTVYEPLTRSIPTRIRDELLSMQLDDQLTSRQHELLPRIDFRIKFALYEPGGEYATIREALHAADPKA